jgi:hypothetical protein
MVTFVAMLAVDRKAGIGPDGLSPIRIGAPGIKGQVSLSVTPIILTSAGILLALVMTRQVNGTDQIEQL